MMDCKKALQETDGDISAAIDWLRAKGLSKAAKKADRVAAEGLVAVASKEDGKGEVGAAIEFNSETDFVARNELFQNAAKAFAQKGLEHHTVEALHGAELENGNTIQAEVTNMIATIGENMQLRRAARLSVDEGVVASYVHNAVSPGLGRIGVLVALHGGGDKAALRELGRKIAMHVAATAPPGRYNVQVTALAQAAQAGGDSTRAVVGAAKGSGRGASSRGPSTQNGSL
jgi:elongation factor Ts